MTAEWGAPPERVSPPTAPEVARRLLCVVASSFRASMEVDPRGPHLPAFLQPDEDRKDLARWAKKEKLTKSASISETYWWTSPVGDLEDDDVEGAATVGYAVLPLLWALQHLQDMPPVDVTDENTRRAMSDLPLYKPIAPFVAAASLRPHAEIEAAREVAELWLFRARMLEEEDEETGKVPAQLKRELAARIARAQSAGADLPLVHGDLTVLGKPYSKLDEDEQDACYALAIQRLRALNWLCGYAADWDHVPVDA
jgi:hypothetical protein